MPRARAGWRSRRARTCGRAPPPAGRSAEILAQHARRCCSCGSSVVIERLAMLRSTRRKAAPRRARSTCGTTLSCSISYSVRASSRSRRSSSSSLRGRLDRPAVLAVVALVPPAVEHREVERAVDARLHARRAGGLQRVRRGCSATRPRPAPGGARGAGRSPRRTGSGPRTPGAATSCTMRADQLLARLVGRVRLAGEEEQHRALRVAERSARSRSRSLKSSVARL